MTFSVDLNVLSFLKKIKYFKAEDLPLGFSLAEVLTSKTPEINSSHNMLAL